MDVEDENKEIHDKELESVQLEKDKVIDKLSEQIAKFENLKMKYLANDDKLQKLYDMGIIDNQGEYIHYKPGEEDEMRWINSCEKSHQIV